MYNTAHCYSIASLKMFITVHPCGSAPSQVSSCSSLGWLESSHVSECCHFGDYALFYMSHNLSLGSFTSFQVSHCPSQWWHVSSQVSYFCLLWWFLLFYVSLSLIGVAMSHFRYTTATYLGSFHWVMCTTTTHWDSSVLLRCSTSWFLGWLCTVPDVLLLLFGIFQLCSNCLS